MKTQLRKLNRLIKIACLNPENYYSIDVTNYDIRFQGEFNHDLTKELSGLFGEGRINKVNGHVEFSRYNISVILT